MILSIDRTEICNRFYLNSLFIFRFHLGVQHSFDKVWSLSCYILSFLSWTSSYMNASSEVLFFLNLCVYAVNCVCGFFFRRSLSSFFNKPTHRKHFMQIKAKWTMQPNHILFRWIVEFSNFVNRFVLTDANKNSRSKTTQKKSIHRNRVCNKLYISFLVIVFVVVDWMKEEKKNYLWVISGGRELQLT